MENRAARYLLGFCVTIVTGILLQCLYAELGGTVLSVLVPVSLSPWEQGKLCFWPYLAGALLIWRLGETQDSRGGHCALLLVMPMVMMFSCWLMGIDTRQGIIAAWIIVLAAGIALYALVLRRWLWGGELLWYTLAILMGIAYLLLTAMPPMGGPFTDPVSLPTMAIPV